MYLLEGESAKHQRQTHMQLKKNLTALLALATFAIATAVQAADATGSWTWTRQGRNGGNEVKMTLKLKVAGEKLTGTLSSPGRDGQVTDTGSPTAK
jgi:hypothetical protein